MNASISLRTTSPGNVDDGVELLEGECKNTGDNKVDGEALGGVWLTGVVFEVDGVRTSVSSK